MLYKTVTFLALQSNLWAAQAAVIGTGTLSNGNNVSIPAVSHLASSSKPIDV